MLKWFADRLARTGEDVKKDERGFTLIELLVVVIIIGILAAIAIPTFLNQRESAQESAAESDLRNAASAAQAYAADNDGSYAFATGTLTAGHTLVDDYNFNSTDGVTTEVTASSDGSYTMQATAENGTVFELTSDSGTVTQVSP